MTTGPKDPYCPVGDPLELGRTSWGVLVQCQEFPDGWLYQIAIPRYEGLAWSPRPALSSVIFRGRLIDAWNEEGVNYLGLWLGRALHEQTFPDGPRPGAIFSRDDMDKETAQLSYEEWRAERATSLSGPFLALERVQEEDPED